MSTELIERANAIIEKANLADRMSFFQIEKFVIGKEVTIQAQLWQIVKELEARSESVDSFTDQISEAEDQLEMFEVEIERFNLKLQYLKINPPEPVLPQSLDLHRLEMQELEINIRRVERKRDALVKAAKKVVKKRKFILEEMNCLIAAFDKVIAVAGEVKSLDDRSAQREMWNEKYLEEFNLRVLLKRPMDSEFIRCVLALDDDAPVKKHVVDLITRQQQLMVEFYKQQAQAKCELAAPAKDNKPVVHHNLPTTIPRQEKPKVIPQEIMKPKEPPIPSPHKQKGAIIGRKKR